MTSVNLPPVVPIHVASLPYTQPPDIETGLCCSCLPGSQHAPRADGAPQSAGSKLQIALCTGVQGALRDGINQLGGLMVSTTVKSTLKSLASRSSGWATGVTVASGISVTALGGACGWRAGELLGHASGYKDHKGKMLAFKTGGALLGAGAPLAGSVLAGTQAAKMAVSLSSSLGRMLGQVTRDLLNQAQRGAWGSMKIKGVKEPESFDLPRVHASAAVYAGLSIAHQMYTKTSLTQAYDIGSPRQSGLTSVKEVFEADMGTVTSAAALEALDAFQGSVMAGLRAIQTGKELDYVEAGGLRKILENLGILAQAWTPTTKEEFSSIAEGPERDTKIREMSTRQRQETGHLAKSHTSMRVLGGAFTEALQKAAGTCEKGSQNEKVLLGLAGVLNGLTEYRGFLVSKGLWAEEQIVGQAEIRIQEAVYGWGGNFAQAAITPTPKSPTVVPAEQPVREESDDELLHPWPVATETSSSSTGSTSAPGHTVGEPAYPATTTLLTLPDTVLDVLRRDPPGEVQLLPGQPETSEPPGDPMSPTDSVVNIPLDPASPTGPLAPGTVPAGLPEVPRDPAGGVGDP